MFRQLRCWGLHTCGFSDILRKHNLIANYPLLWILLFRLIFQSDPWASGAAVVDIPDGTELYCKEKLLWWVGKLTPINAKKVKYVECSWRLCWFRKVLVVDFLYSSCTLFIFLKHTSKIHKDGLLIIWNVFILYSIFSKNIMSNKIKLQTLVFRN